MTPLQTGGVAQRRPYGLGYLRLLERETTAVPLVNRRIQRGKAVPAAAEPGQLYGREQGGVGEVGQQPGRRVPAPVSNRDPQVEQGGAAAEMEGTGVGVGVGHGPAEIGAHMEGAAALKVAEAPWLRVVHRRCGRGVADQGRHTLRGECSLAHRCLPSQVGEPLDGARSSDVAGSSRRNACREKRSQCPL